MITLNIHLTQLAILLAIFVRVGVVLFMLPIFNSSGVPNAFKALFLVAFSVMLYPVISPVTRPIPLDPGALTSVIIGELVFGVLFALSMLLIISAFQLAGELLDFEIGFGFAQTASPQGGPQTTVISSFGQLLAIMIFLSINGHLIVIKILVQSFKSIPVGSFALSAGLFSRLLMLSGRMFVLAIKLAGPVLAVLMLTQVGLGLMAKFAPQMNILATSFPLTIVLGMLFFGITLALWGRLGIQSFYHLFHFLKLFSR